MRSGVTVKWAAGAWAVLGLLAWVGPVAAQDPRSLRDALFGPLRRDDRSVPLPAVARYQGEAGERFVLDRSNPGPALMRFEDSPEIWVLKPTPGPRGDTVFRDDLGEPVLRATRVGGLTLFTGQRPMGMAAALSGPAALLRPLAIASPAQLLASLVQASSRASRAAQHLISFEAPDYQPGTEPVWADAAMLTAEAFVHVASAGRSGREALARYIRVRFYPGRAPGAAVAGREVRIVIVPKDGFAGRPSSKRIATVIAAR